MFLDRITTSDKHLLLLQSNATTRLFERIAGEWEPVDPSIMNGIVISGKARVEGIMLADMTDQLLLKTDSCTFID